MKRSTTGARDIQARLEPGGVFHVEVGGVVLGKDEDSSLAEALLVQVVRALEQAPLGKAWELSVWAYYDHVEFGLVFLDKHTIQVVSQFAGSSEDYQEALVDAPALLWGLIDSATAEARGGNWARLVEQLKWLTTLHFGTRAQLGL